MGNVAFYNCANVVLTKSRNRGQCVCGLPGVFNPLTASPSTLCTLPCAVDDTQICGGLTSISVYSSSSAPYSPASQLLSNLIQNPFFNNSASTVCNANWCVSSNNSGIAPWYVTVGSIYELDQSVWPNYNGSQFSMDLSASVPYAIGQMINTVPGFPYMVTYMLSINPAEASTPVKRGFIRATGVAESLFAQSTTTWTAKYYNFVATSSLTLLEIGSTTSSWGGPVLGRMYRKTYEVMMIFNAIR